MPVVAAVNATIARAVALGHLRDRLDEPFECYMPDKEEDGRRYPELIDARCSIHRYMGQYVEAEIAKIPQADIDASVAGRHKTVLVVGPKQFVRPIYQRLQDGRYPQTELRVSDPLPVLPIDGYRRIARDPESNLGWRILIHCEPFRGWMDDLRDALTSGGGLVTHLPAAWRDDRLVVARLLGRALDGETLSDPEFDRLAESVEMERGALHKYIQAGEPGEEEGEPTAPPTAAAESDGPAPPSILCTTLKGAKGLSAEHVFVVGLMNGHFPDRAGAPSDEEICEFLVALSRTRKQCHLVSTRIFAGPPPLRPSVFLSWMSGQTRQITVDKDFW